MSNDLRAIRRARYRAACALVAICVFIPAAGMGQAANDTAAKAPAATKPSTATPAATKPASSATAGAKTSTSATHTASAGHHSSHRRRSTRVRGQKKIDPDRARTIQEALIREHYLSGESTGTWNQASEDAMRRYQSDHGWQTVEVPDSRALIALGLGPSKDRLLNPESAMTTGPRESAAADAKPPAPSPAPATPNPPAPTPPASSSPQ